MPSGLGGCWGGDRAGAGEGRLLSLLALGGSSFLSYPCAGLSRSGAKDPADHLFLPAALVRSWPIREEREGRREDVLCGSRRFLLNSCTLSLSSPHLLELQYNLPQMPPRTLPALVGLLVTIFLCSFNLKIFIFS